MKSKEKKSKPKVPEGKFMDITQMFQQKQSNMTSDHSFPKQKVQIPEVEEEEQKESYTPLKKKTEANKPLKKEKDQPKTKALSPAKNVSQQKKKTLITDSNEESDIKGNPSSEMDVDDSPKEKKTKRQKSSAKKPRPSTNKKGKKKNDQSSDNEIIGPLSGKTIVVTGLFAMSRDDISNILKGLGAKVTGSVSTKTSILLHGDKLEDGRDFDQGNKYKTAKQKKVTIYSIEEFDEFMREQLKDETWSLASFSTTDIKPLSLGKTMKQALTKSIDITSNNNGNELWTSKYKPNSLEDIVGNQKNISNLIQWLDDWEDVVLKGNKKKSAKPSFRGGRPQFENLNAKACLITGDPGIGKTSSVRLIAQLKGYKTFETNASEQRNKAAIKAKVGFLFDNTTLYTGDIQTKNLIIMDEIDGIGGNEDRGGIAALIDIIKKTKTPIICIANDRQSMKLKSLVNHCYDLKFSKPDKRQVSNRLKKICSYEGIQVEQNALEFLCESVGNDIRQCINFLELWSKNHKILAFNEVKGTYHSFNKDTVNMISNFEAAQKLLNSSIQKLPFRERVDLFFIDYDLIPLLVQENYLSCFKQVNCGSDEVAKMVEASEHISMADMIDKRIRVRQDWSLLGDKGIMSSVAVNSVIKGSIPFPKFPEILGKMSSMKKVKRELKELKHCFPDVASKAIKIEVAPLFLSLVTKALVEEDKEKCLQMMNKYKMTMTFFKENILDLNEKDLKTNYDRISSTIKAGLTREYNKSHQTVIGKSKRGKVLPIEEEMEYDPDGNLLNTKQESSNKGEDEDEDAEEDSTKEKKTKVKRTKAATKAKTKEKEETNQLKTKKGKKKQRAEGE